MDTSAIKVEKLFIYPIKSCRGIAVDHLQLGRHGTKNDRTYMLIDDRGCFVTQRQHPTMATIHTALADDNVIEARAKGRAPLLLSKEQRTGEPFEGLIWKERVQLIEVSTEASGWFSDFLSTNVRLVKLNEADGREKSKPPLAQSYHVSFPDSAPVMLANQASVDDLAAQSGMSVPFQRFRPNILVSGAPAWSEDHWSTAKVGGVRFPLSYPCDRCIVIAIDQNLGVKGREPFATLSQFRRGGRLSFGVRMVHQGSGVIRLGDSVQPDYQIT